MTLPEISPAARSDHHRWLLELTALPTASGKEHRVIEWITRWSAQRPEIALTPDPSGNLVLSFKIAAPSTRPIFFTAHLDHPAFVVERLVAPGTIELSFRGGVMDDYFTKARIVIHDAHGHSHRAVLAEKTRAEGEGKPYAFYIAELESNANHRQIAPGDIAVWDIGPAEIQDGILHTLGCDDLSAVAAALAAFDQLLQQHRASPPDVRLLFTRAEEIGFIGAIAACKHGTLPRNARVIALENSRSFPDSPIGGGPIVRVGDRVSVFSPSLTDAIAKRAEQIAGAPATPTASQKLAAAGWKWQRKLMAGGACEASVFYASGYEATCLCLPLGNYHNMADLTNVQAGLNTTPPTVGREFISVADFDGLVDLLIACGISLPDGGGFPQRIEKLWNDRSFVLND